MVRTAKKIFGQSRGEGEPLFDRSFQRKLEKLALLSRKVQGSRMRGERRSTKLGQGMEFADHREYAPGDDTRFVDWNAYQRLGRLLVRRFEEQEDRAMYLLLDCSASMAFGSRQSFDQARRLCAALAYVGLSNMDRVGIGCLAEGRAQVIAPARGKGQIFNIFKALSECRAAGNTQLHAAVDHFARQASRGGLVVLVSDFYDPAGFEGSINALRYRQFEPAVVHTQASNGGLGEDVPPGDVELVDCETGQRVEVTVTSALLSRVQAAEGEQRRRLEAFCGAAAVTYHRAALDDGLEALVLRMLRDGGLLRS